MRKPTSWNCSLRFKLISGSKFHVVVLWITGAPTKLFCNNPRIISNGPSAFNLSILVAISNYWKIKNKKLSLVLLFLLYCFSIFQKNINSQLFTGTLIKLKSNCSITQNIIEANTKICSDEFIWRVLLSKTGSHTFKFIPLTKNTPL